MVRLACLRVNDARASGLIVMSKKSFVDGGEVVNDQILATAIFNRVLQLASTVNLKRNSYRLREKKKAGLPEYKPKSRPSSTQRDGS